MKPTDKQVARMAEFMDTYDGIIDDAARATLAFAWSLYEERAKYVVVGAIMYDPRLGGSLDPDAPFTEKVALGGYATQGDAQKAARSLSSHYHSGVKAATFVLPFDSVTPNDYYQTRKKAQTPEGAAPRTWGEMAQDMHEQLERKVRIYDANPGILSLPPDFDIEKRCYVCGAELKED